MDKQIYIHYGTTKFDPTYNFNIKNQFLFTKPHGGLWASRIDASFGWKDWNDIEDYKPCNDNCAFKFTIKDGAHVAIIHTREDVSKLPLLTYPDEYNSFNKMYIDFEKCIEEGVDAIELCAFGDEYKDVSQNMYYALYAWDCDSIVILNPDIVEVI